MYILTTTALYLLTLQNFNILRYENTQHYDSHLDVFYDHVYGKQFSQRVITVLVYLTDVEEGGETVFKAEGKDGVLCSQLACQLGTAACAKAEIAGVIRHCAPAIGCTSVVDATQCSVCCYHVLSSAAQLPHSSTRQTLVLLVANNNNSVAHRHLVNGQHVVWLLALSVHRRKVHQCYAALQVSLSC